MPICSEFGENIFARRPALEQGADDARSLTALPYASSFGT